jgi:hypothetical protein
MLEQIEVSLDNGVASFLDKSMVSLLLLQAKDMRNTGLASMHSGSKKMTSDGEMDPSL